MGLECDFNLKEENSLTSWAHIKICADLSTETSHLSTMELEQVNRKDIC